jgi:putative transposase
MVSTPSEYPWSSFQTNGLGEKNEIITPHTVYQALGENPEIRQQAYRELFRYELDPGVLEEIRRATNGNFALGSDRFNEQIAKVLGKRVTPGKAGRPRKERK